MKVRIYKPLSEKAGFFSILRELLRDIPKANNLGFRLASRNIHARYRQSMLGFVWAILPPLAISAIWIFLNASKIIRMDAPEIPYPVFVSSGTIIWQVFASSVMSPMQSVTQNQSLLVKINFPREAVFIAGFYEVLFNSVISTAIALIIAFTFGEFPGWTFIFYFPALFIMVIFGISIGLFILPIGVLFRDIQFGLPVVLQFLMYLSPVVYVSADFFGLAFLNDFNPMVIFLNFLRGALTSGDIAGSIFALGIISLISLFLAMVGAVIQRVTMEILVERMGA